MALTDGLIHYYKLGESTGNRVDSVGALPMTRLSGTVGSAGGYLGLGASPDPAADFSNADAGFLATAASPDFRAAQPFTLCGWVYLPNTGQTEVMVLVTNPIVEPNAVYKLPVQIRVSYPTGTTGSVTWKASLSNAPDGQEFAQPAATSVSLTRPRKATDWSFVILSHDPTNREILLTVDGLTKRTIYPAGTTLSALDAKLGIGGSAFEQYMFDGRVQGVGFYNRCLTDAERYLLYAGGNPKAIYPFTDSSLATSVTYQNNANAITPYKVVASQYNDTGLPTSDTVRWSLPVARDVVNPTLAWVNSCMSSGENSTAHSAYHGNVTVRATALFPGDTAPRTVLWGGADFIVAPYGSVPECDPFMGVRMYIGEAPIVNTYYQFAGSRVLAVTEQGVIGTANGTNKLTSTDNNDFPGATIATFVPTLLRGTIIADNEREAVGAGDSIYPWVQKTVDIVDAANPPYKKIRHIPLAMAGESSLTVNTTSPAPGGYSARQIITHKSRRAIQQKIVNAIRETADFAQARDAEVLSWKNQLDGDSTVSHLMAAGATPMPANPGVPETNNWPIARNQYNAWQRSVTATELSTRLGGYAVQIYRFPGGTRTAAGARSSGSKRQVDVDFWDTGGAIENGFETNVFQAGTTGDELHPNDNGENIIAAAAAPLMAQSFAASIPALTLPQLATPTIAPNAGTVASGEQATVTGPNGATLRYTDDESTPMSSSPVYTGPITLTGSGTTATTATIKAKAFAAGYSDSGVAVTLYSVLPPLPTILTQPSNVSVQAGNTATFTANASNFASVKAQRNDGSGWADITGATSSSYTTPALTTGNDGVQFRFAYTNAGGTTYTNAATVTVTSAPPPTPIITGVVIKRASQTVTAITVVNENSVDLDALVEGSNSPSQAVTWTKPSGAGSVDSTGLVTLPAKTSQVQTVVIRATAQGDSHYGEVTITIPAQSSGGGGDNTDLTEVLAALAVLSAKVDALTPSGTVIPGDVRFEFDLVSNKQQFATSTEFVVLAVRAFRGPLPMYAPDYTVQLAVTKAAPEDDDFHAATWNQDGLSALLVGPVGGAVELTPGVYYVHAKVSNAPEVTVARVGLLTIL